MVIVRNGVIDSSRWNWLEYRKGDIVIATFGKTGTTWVQQIVGQLIFQGADEVAVSELSPWVEYLGTPLDVLIEQLESQKHRRFFKTHLPSEAIPISEDAYYIYVARDARDQLWSAYNHLAKLSSKSLILRELQMRTGEDQWRLPSIRDYYHSQLDRNGSDAWPFWSNVLSWWRIRKLPNVLLVHYSNLKRDLDSEIRRLIEFLGIDLSGAAWPKVIEHVQFDYMRRNARKIIGDGADALHGGAPAFFDRGINGRWKNILTSSEVAKCDEIALSYLPRDCAHWLKTGRNE